MVQQINLKIPDSFYEEVEIYAKSHGYMSIQELTRDALRDKIYDDLEIREEYKKVLQSKEANTFSSIKDSEKFLESLREKANKFKNKKKSK